MKTKYLVASMLGIVILSLAVYSSLHTVSEIVITNVDEPNTSGDGFGSTMGVTLVIEHERDGEQIYKMVKEDDLILRSFAGLVHYMMKGTDVENSLVYDSTTGSQITANLYSYNYKINPQTAQIQIGTGTTPADYTDYKLGTEVYYDYTEAVSYNVAGLQYNVSVTSTFNILGSHAITEAGFETVHYSMPTSTNIMLFRDVFGAINVISGDILTVSYIIMMN